MIRGSSVNIVTRLQSVRSGSSPDRGRDFSLRHRVHTGSGFTQLPIQWVGTRVFLAGVERPRREADHSPPSSAEGKGCPHGVVLN
jgi:hypothetical protein